MERLTFEGNFCDITQCSELPCPYGGNCTQKQVELEVDAKEVVVPLYETGKVRAPKAKVLREVPLEEAGLLGKMIAKRLNRCKTADPDTGEIV